MLDALTISHLCSELNILCKGRIDKINMPDRSDVVFTIKNGGVFQLLVSANPQYARVHLSKKNYETPPTPLAFCLHLRKHLQGGIIEKIEQIPFERVIKFTIEVKDKLFCNTYFLYCEIMGKYSNIVLVNANGVITDSLVHVSADTSSKRIVLPALKYDLPPAQENKIAIDDKELFCATMQQWDASNSAHNFLVSRFYGFAPATLAVAVKNANFSYPFSICDCERLYDSIQKLYTTFSPCIEYKDGVMIGFYPFAYSDFQRENFDSLSEAIDKFYSETFTQNAHLYKAKKAENLVKNAISRCEKKITSTVDTLQKAQNGETDRIYGELITANIYKIKYGDQKIEVLNYYDGQTVTILLDPALTPAKNAQKYYTLYAKKKRTIEVFTTVLQQTVDKKEYLETLLLSITQCKNQQDLLDVFVELESAGLIKKQNKKTQKRKSSPRKFVVDGHVVLIGKNNLQNDELVRSSDGGFTWLHTQKIHGSHTVIQGKDVSLSTIKKVASYTAFYSKASQSENVPVDYTLIKYVKKPSGALPGKVIYTHQQTVFVTPVDPEK